MKTIETQARKRAALRAADLATRYRLRHLGRAEGSPFRPDAIKGRSQNVRPGGEPRPGLRTNDFHAGDTLSLDKIRL